MTPSMRRVLKEKELWILASLVIAYFFHILFLGETLYYRDLGLHFLPQKNTFVDLIRRGNLPLWNPYDSESFVANASHIPLYPSNLFYLAFPVIRVFNWDITIHLIMCVGGAYLFARIIELGRTSSFVAGLIYGFSGLSLSAIGALNQFLSMPGIPLIFASWHLFLLTTKKRYFVSTVVFGFLQLLAGTPELPFGVLGSLLIWSLCYPYPGVSPKRKFMRWMLMVVFVTGLSAIQIFPMAELVSHSPRAMAIAYTPFTKWSLHPKRLPEMIIHSFLGRVDSLDAADYWGTSLESGGEPLYLSIYFGPTVLALAFLALSCKTMNSSIPVACRRLLFLIALIPLIFSFGSHLPFFRFLHELIPPLRVFRFPSKFLLYTIFPISILAAYCCHVYFERDQLIPSKKTIALLWSFPIFFLFLYILFSVSLNFSNDFQRFFFEEDPQTRIRERLLVSIRHSLILSTGTAFIFQHRRIAFRAFLIRGLVLIIAIDLLFSGRHINPSAPEEFLTTRPFTAELVRQEIEDGRLYPPQDPGHFVLRSPANDAIWYVRWELEMLMGYAATSFQIPIMFYTNISDTTPAYLKEHYELVEKIPWNLRIPFLSAGSVKLILTDQELQISGLDLIAEIPNRSQNKYYLYKNNRAVPRIYFATTWISRDTPKEVIPLMLSPTFDPANHVVLQQPDANLVHHDCPRAELKVSNVSSNAQAVTIENRCEGYLVFSDPYYPGWRVKVDGKQVPIIKANGAFSAIYLSPGNHQVERFYRPRSLILGFLCSILFFGLLLVIRFSPRDKETQPA